MRVFTLLVIVCLEVGAGAVAADPTVHLRANQVGYLPGEAKIAVAFSDTSVAGTFSLLGDDSTRVAFTGEIVKSPASGWGGFTHYYWLDFSHYDVPGRYQQGNSFGAPYRYSETTWADDMEWAAAELFQETGEPADLNDATRYARLAADTSWMPLETAGHYEYYPFVNVGHFALYPHVDAATQAQLAAYYRRGLEATLSPAQGNAFRVGVPFIWCSNNLTTALVTQILLQRKSSHGRDPGASGRGL